ncbi:MAG: ABC-type transport auxiliary lipoprotein family protein [Allosphingosinicella sp.]|uniref:ABC-type transport auxiliary lipoprotein family protein n=1 Tax=Allosphingosinicella sp. TaxID=2823234 RepID=UPI00394E6657
MTMRLKLISAAAAALTLTGCAGLGGRTPPELLTLTPAQSRPAQAPRTAGQGEAITVVEPTVPQELRTNRVPVRTAAGTIQYLRDATWVENPSALFGRLVSETIAATTGRVVLDPRQYTHDPGLRLTGQLQSFGLDEARMEAVAVYDAAIARGAGISTNRFEARVPVTSAAPGEVSAALNQAANRIAADVAVWVGR